MLYKFLVFKTCHVFLINLYKESYCMDGIIWSMVECFTRSPILVACINWYLENLGYKVSDVMNEILNVCMIVLITIINIWIPLRFYQLLNNLYDLQVLFLFSS